MLYSNNLSYSSSNKDIYSLFIFLLFISYKFLRIIDEFPVKVAPERITSLQKILHLILPLFP